MHQTLPRPLLTEPDRTVPEQPAGIPDEYWLNTVDTFRRAINAISDLAQDWSHRIDEYQPMEWTPDSETVIEVFPEYELCDEVIEAIVITGPTASPAATLQLGKWITGITLPASQVLVIAPVKFKLGRNDRRILTPAAAGAWSLRLTGFADWKGRVGV